MKALPVLLGKVNLLYDLFTIQTVGVVAQLHYVSAL